MSPDPNLSCRQDARRDAVRAAPLYGLDFVEVSDDQKTLEVFFLGKAPPQITPAHVRISGGTRVTGIQVTSVRVYHEKDPTIDDHMVVVVNQPGDFSPYTLTLVSLDAQGHPTTAPMEGFDPWYSSLFFTFKAGCPTNLDCKTTQVCPPPQRTTPQINYLSKDYASFRQLILDRLSLLMPAWQETHAADIGIMLVEVLAYVGDYLSYYQDAVATEVYLGTSRQRISVRRHARLVDYFIQEGCNARAWITTAASQDTPLDPTQIYFTTALPGKLNQTMFQPADMAMVTPGSYVVFEPLGTGSGQIQLYAAHNEIHFYTWGDNECCLAIGATSATLVDQWVDAPGGARVLAHLAPGNVLIFEEVIGPHTGNPADADPSHRQAVCLTQVNATTDALYNQPIVEIAWCSEDALTFPLCVSTRQPAPDCGILSNVSVARGNVLLVDNGASTSESLGTVPAQSSSAGCPTPCDPPETTVTPGRFHLKLSQQPLTFAQPLPACGCATPTLTQDPRQALPKITLTGTGTTPRGVVTTTWKPLYDLLESGPNDTVFVVEIDNNGYAHLRFGDGELGMLPDAGTVFQANYRVGNGTAGNVGAGAICCLVFRQTTGGVGQLVPRNPLPAAGGTDPESIDDVKFFAPYAFQDVLERAITAGDYSSIASGNARRLEERSANLCGTPFQKLQGAKAALRWNGSWQEALVALDPQGTESASAELVREVRQYLEPYRRVLHDLEVTGATYVPLYLALDVCVLPQYLQAGVEAALLQLFGAGTLPNGQPAFFNPDNLTFGQGIYVSRIVAAAQAVAGVQSVRVARLQRYQFDVRAGTAMLLRQPVPSTGVLALGPFEIAQLDNDPSFPERGRLVLKVRGGR